MKPNNLADFGVIWLSYTTITVISCLRAILIAAQTKDFFSSIPEIFLLFTFALFGSGVNLLLEGKLRFPAMLLGQSKQPC